MNLSARAHKNLQSALAGALLGGLMASPRVGAAAVLNGLTAFTQGVLPFLFPFSCLAQLLACGRRAPLWALRLTGMLGGSPTGARLLAEVGDERAARRSAMMTGGVSPMFFAGTLALWLDSRADGTILLASHLGALAVCCCRVGRRAISRRPRFPCPRPWRRARWPCCRWAGASPWARWRRP